MEYFRVSLKHEIYQLGDRKMPQNAAKSRRLEGREIQKLIPDLYLTAKSRLCRHGAGIKIYRFKIYYHSEIRKNPPAASIETPKNDPQLNIARRAYSYLCSFDQH